MAVTKLVDLGITRVWWVVDPAFVATAPTVALITAGKDLSTYLLPDYEFTADSSTTISERDITATAEADTPTIGKVKASLHLFRSYTVGTGVVDPVGDLEATFLGLPTGWLIRRTGPTQSTAPLATQKVEVANFIADIPQKEGGAGTGFLKLTVPLLPQGLYYPSVALV
jgi:hypothetical protein